MGSAGFSAICRSVLPTLGRLFRPVREKIFGPLIFFPFGGICALETKLSLSISVQESILFLRLVKNQREQEQKNKLSRSSAPFWLFLFKVSQNFTPNLAGCPNSYLASFELCGQIFGKLKILHEFADRQAKHPNVLTHLTTNFQNPNLWSTNINSGIFIINSV